jgi:hypothetical protein
LFAIAASTPPCQSDLGAFLKVHSNIFVIAKIVFKRLAEIPRFDQKRSLMKPTNVPHNSDLTHLDADNRRVHTASLGLFLRVGAILVFAGLLVSIFYSASSASSARKRSLDQISKTVARTPAVSRAIAAIGGSPSLRVDNVSSLLPLPQGGVSVTTYANDCTTPKTVFNLQDADKTVCAKVTGADPSWRIIWSNANSVAVQNVPVGSGTSTFTLTATASLGDWRVILFEPFGGTVQTVTSFTVIDDQNPEADLSISNGAISSNASSSSQVLFSIQVSNGGPDAAAVQLSDSVPANTTFVSFDQLDGPTFTCTSPNAGDTGTTICTIGSLARGASAVFVATYQVGAVPNGTVISNTSSATSTTPDPNSENNSSTAILEVVSAACQLSSPNNITVSADSGQAGAIVTYTTPTGTGDCGQTTTGENGETIPAISCNPASGSFFPVGTSTVICTAQTGPVVSFQVTVDNPGALSISLSGANPLVVECGTDFSDPGASAVDGTGQSLPVTITYPSGFSPDAPAVGSYEVIYTATVDPNSVSVTRTVNVSDSEAPAITIDGANPYKIQQGSCSPFVDPGSSALDGCAGPKPVSSSISGPNGLTSVDPNTPGTYTVTYTATDGAHQATATRTVLVGQFPDDEVDQPASSNQPPTITLNGDAQISIECGTPFTDPGATATVCGNSIPVTTSGTFDIHTPGTYSITYRASANNQTAETTRIVTVGADNTAPTITVNGANPMTVECHTSFTDPGATAHDACAGDFAATASGTVDPNTVGQYVITYNATDPSGHAAAPVTRTVNVVDTTAPTVIAPPNVTVNTGPGATACGTAVSDATLGTASANDSCAGSLSVTRTGVPAGNVFPVGQTTITYSANDGRNTGNATQKVTVIDNTAPVISCLTNITLEPTCPSGAIATYTPPVGTDNCAGATTVRTAGLASGSVFPIGTTTVTHTVTDASGNSASCSFTVTVFTPQAVIQTLINSVSSSSLTGTQKNGLLAKLNAALDGLNGGQTNVACNKLDAFVNSVQTLVSHGDITSAQGTSWINSANHVRNTIGCTNLGCS